IFEDIVPHLAPHTILTSNTSSISITRLASRTDRPEKFMGFHFMNPVPVMQLVELIRGRKMSNYTLSVGVIRVCEAFRRKSPLQDVVVMRKS
uniref:3-hydroxyacyl-CoA dehydrogenase NAD-binding domain-containing protein n=1 Tax=Okeania sp. SIO2F4 TaxID=2607790 RepID=UPI0025E1AE29